MSRTIKSLPVIAMSLLVYMTSCKKENNSSQHQNNVTSYFESNMNMATQNFTVDASANSVIVGNDGTRITFLPGSFKTASGVVVTGAVNVHLVEALNYADMLKLNSQTLGIDGGIAKMLVSGGQIKLTAVQNNIPLQLVPGKSIIDIPFAASPDPNMNVFYGSDNEAGNLEWTIADTNAISIATDSTGSYYSFPNDHVGWINCDYFYNDAAPQTEVTLNLPTGHTNANTKAWIVFSSLNSVACFEGVSTTSNAILNIGHGLCPVGATVSIVVLSQLNGQYSSAIVNTTITSNHQETITLTNTTTADFETQISSL